MTSFEDYWPGSTTTPSLRDIAPEGAFPRSFAEYVEAGVQRLTASRDLFRIAEALPHGYHVAVVRCREGAYPSAAWRILVVPNDKRHRMLKGTIRSGNGATIAEAVAAATAQLAERPLEGLPDLGPSSKTKRLRQRRVADGSQLRDDVVVTDEVHLWSDKHHELLDKIRDASGGAS